MENLFAKNLTAKEQKMETIKEIGFRRLYQQYVYIEHQDKLDILGQYFEGSEQATGVLAYCYVDHEAGLTFEVLALAKKAGEALDFYSGNDTITIKFRYGSVAESEALLLSNVLPPLKAYAEKAERIAAAYAYSEAVAKTRLLANLDICRHEEYPDDVLVYLVHGDDHIEGCYARLEDVGEMNLTGILLNEPVYDFGVHQGDSFSFYLVKNERGIMCMAIR